MFSVLRSQMYQIQIIGAFRRPKNQFKKKTKNKNKKPWARMLLLVGEKSADRLLLRAFQKKSHTDHSQNKSSTKKQS